MNFNRHPMLGGGGGGGGGGGRVGGGGLGPENKGGCEGGSGLARQPSIYSLTFDEFQSTLGGPGKDFGSMNMDELLKNIWTAEESQTMGAAVPGFSDVGLQQQGSFTLPRTLSQKTVDEVWRDLVLPGQGPPVPSAGAAAAAAAAAAASAGVSHQPRQPTLGEMTLEEFLFRAGVVREEHVAPTAAILPPRPLGDSGHNSSRGNRVIDNVLFGDLSVANNAGLSLGFSPAGRSSRDVSVASPIANGGTANLAAMAAPESSPFGVPYNVVDLGNHQGVRGGGLVGIGETGMNNGLMSGAVGLGAGTGPVSVVSPVNHHLPSDTLRKSGGDQSSVSPVPYVFSGGMRGRKSSVVEKVFERRQRRMIKNRESAARSRARKQAYTMELEAEVAKLKELNQELQKKQAEIMELQKNQVLEIINNQRGPKKRCLRRTQTGPW